MYPNPINDDGSPRSSDKKREFLDDFPIKDDWGPPRKVGDKSYKSRAFTVTVGTIEDELLAKHSEALERDEYDNNPESAMF